MKNNLLLASIVAAVAVSVGFATYAMPGEGRGQKDHENRDFHKNYGTGSTGHQDFGNHLGKDDSMMIGLHGMEKDGKRHGMFGSGIKAAIVAKDYTAFVKAWNTAQASILVPTQAEFTKQVTRYTAHQAVEAAVLANNYEAFKTALAVMPKPMSGDIKPLPPVPTAEQFTSLVAMKKAHIAVETAILANDYTAFKTAFAAIPVMGKHADKILPTAENFITMVAMAKKKATIESTLKANDYNAFAIAWTAHKPTVPTQVEFTKIIAKQGEIKEDRKHGDRDELKKDKKDRNTMLRNKLKVKMNAMKEKNKKK